MIFKTPLGFIALIAIIILLIIYLIKPTYQNKVIASTYIWKSSLKFKKNKRPVSKLLNIFTIIVQILIIINISLILSTMMITLGTHDRSKQEIMIIDSSYSMSIGTTSRLDKAKALAMENAKRAVNDNKKVSIINLSDEAKFVVAKELDIGSINKAIESITPTYFKNDVSDAIALCNEALKENPESKVSFYTDKDYKNSLEVEVINLRDKDDWNSAILNAKSESVDNFYEFYVDMITYGADRYLNVVIRLANVNETSSTKEFKQRVHSKDGIPLRAKFKDLGVYSYTGCEIEITSDNDDEILDDNYFYLPSSIKDVIRVQYYSKKPNNFFQGAINTLANKYSDYFNLEISQPKTDSEAKDSGYDFYIYEHTSPKVLPNDGVVFIVNPETLPKSVGVSVDSEVNGEFSFSKADDDFIISKMDIDHIEAVMYRPLELNDKFKPLIKHDNDIVLATSDDLRTTILSLNLNQSNLPLLIEFPILVNNIFSKYIKPITNKEIYTVGDVVEVNTRGKDVSIKDNGDVIKLNKGGTITLNKPGVYEAQEILLDNRKNTQKIFIRIDSIELDDTNFINNNDSLFILKRATDDRLDIIMYLSISLLALVLLDRFLRRSKSI